jgi:hypothetical protein
MKMLKNLLLLGAISAFAGSLALRAADAKADASNAKVKPYTLKTCIVSGEKLGEMGKPVVITNELREIKFCCKDCVKDFKKEPAKFVKKIEEEEAKAKKNQKN